MNKPFELIYSQQAGDFIEGRHYSNPRFFSSPRSGVSKVFLIGDWPNIRAAYEALGVEVVQLDAPPAPKPLATTAPSEELAAKIADAFPQDPLDHDGDGRRGGSLKGAKSTRAKGARKAKAVADEPEGPNGLTRREMNADLVAAGRDAEPSLGLDDLAKLHDEVKA